MNDYLEGALKVHIRRQDADGKSRATTVTFRGSEFGHEDGEGKYTEDGVRWNSGIYVAWKNDVRAQVNVRASQHMEFQFDTRTSSESVDVVVVSDENTLRPKF